MKRLKNRVAVSVSKIERDVYLIRVTYSFSTNILIMFDWYRSICLIYVSLGDRSTTRIQDNQNVLERNLTQSAYILQVSQINSYGPYMIPYLAVWVHCKFFRFSRNAKRKKMHSKTFSVIFIVIWFTRSFSSFYEMLDLQKCFNSVLFPSKS